MIRKVGLPYSTYYMIEFAGIDPADGEPMFYKNTTDENGKAQFPSTKDGVLAEGQYYLVENSAPVGLPSLADLATHSATNGLTSTSTLTSRSEHGIMTDVPANWNMVETEL